MICITWAWMILRFSDASSTGWPDLAGAKRAVSSSKTTSRTFQGCFLEPSYKRNHLPSCSSKMTRLRSVPEFRGRRVLRCRHPQAFRGCAPAGDIADLYEDSLGQREFGEAITNPASG